MLTSFFGIPFEFVLFGLTLLGVALFHRRTVVVALIGLGVITGYKMLVTGFASGPGMLGLVVHLEHEWVVLANLFLLLTGFALLSRHFEMSGLPDAMPGVLPRNWLSGVVLLASIFVLSAFLDNIAAALIGGTVARHVFRDKVHLSFLVAIVAAANAGGAASPIGDTTTTMMWIDGVSPSRLVEAAVGGMLGFVTVAIPASIVQHRYAPVTLDPPRGLRVDWTRIAVVAVVLSIAALTNLGANLAVPEVLESFPLIGVSVWVVLALTSPVRRPDWAVIPGAIKGAIFLLALVTAASMMPVQSLPAPSWRTSFGLGLASAVFDNIPLTAMALRQGGYDWGFLAFAVGFGGSLIWFGSSAGVAVANLYPEARSVWKWVRQGWFVPLAYLIGFFGMLMLLEWHPDPGHRRERAAEAGSTAMVMVRGQLARKWETAGLELPGGWMR